MYRNALSQGEVFAETYQVVESLGAGSMGVVYRVRELNTGQDAALKLMHPVLAHDPKSVHRFEREARAGMSIQSPHVARVLATGEDPHTAQRWLVMEYAPGVDLGRYVQQAQPLAYAHSCSLLQQLFLALSAAHQAGVVHRDLKPENIVVHSSNAELRLKVLDFGIAKSLSSATAISTSPGQGTPLWAAPEQTRYDDVPRTTADVWALGLLAFFILTGKLYWLHAQGRSNMLQLSMELVRSAIQPPSVRCQELGHQAALPPHFDDWFMQCVHRDPSCRFESAQPALRGLMTCLERGQ